MTSFAGYEDAPTPLTDRERKQMKRMFSDFFEVPGEWRTALKMELERDPPILGRQTLGGGSLFPGLVTPDASWVPVTSFSNGWANYGSGFPDARVRQLASGLVVMSGLLRGGTLNAVAFALPGAKYRPDLYRHLAGNNQDNWGTLRITSSGDVHLNGPSGASSWFSLDGVSFYP